MKRIENHMVAPIRYKKERCQICGGKSTIPYDENNLDDEREIDCPAGCDNGEVEIEI